MKIYLLRHAETDSNVNRVIQGTLDTDLNETGHRQAECLASCLKSIRPDHIFCSDLKRCKQTLQHVIDQQSREGRPDVIYTSSLQERYMAELQGVSKEKVDQLCREEKKTKFDFGESTGALTDRVETFWRDQVLPLYSSLEGKDDQVSSDEHGQDAVDKTGDKTVFLCSHGGTLLGLMRSLLTTFHFKLPPSILVNRASPNTGVTILDTESMLVEQYADIGHLDQLGSEETKREAGMEVVDA